MARFIAGSPPVPSAILRVSAFTRQKIWGPWAMAAWSSPVIRLWLPRCGRYANMAGETARVGINSRLDAMQAAILGVKLNNLTANNARRQAIAARYDIGLNGLPLALPVRRANATHVFHQYVIRLAERDALRERLRAAGIGTGIHYPVPVHRQPAYEGRLACGPSGLGVTERAAPQILSLPMYPQLSDEAVDLVIAEIRAFFA
jgi:dTDP-4-amino-4,6-dideoxygalactose transaminase